MLGLAVTAGIGFTVALFVAGLAFDGDPAFTDSAKIGILAGSLVSGIIGYLLLKTSPAAPGTADRDVTDPRPHWSTEVSTDEV